jgi:hypothetical protein
MMSPDSLNGMPSAVSHFGVRRSRNSFHVEVLEPSHAGSMMARAFQHQVNGDSLHVPAARFGFDWRRNTIRVVRFLQIVAQGGSA